MADIMKILVVLVALMAIAFIAYWFLAPHKESTANAQVGQKGQAATVVVKGGYSPQTVVLKKGMPGKVNFQLKDSTACLSHVVFDDLGVDKDLTKKPQTTVQIPTDKAGEYDFACGMNMFHGKVVVK
ncbi:hypothetical protein IV45_GL001052 [Limosilactobacillus secaliphilus]|uniref:EfeO-type cupredoxin-like domain-containing protein n=2 Tax=Limosilactobacillus secaliphilus TaxID=396268 RepID=A0A0R2I0D0_9LACO|nr:hypothetical protein IV45_GL001052 [Limosilactobacillus secaliphilus]